VPALNALVSVAWELRRYRTATEAISQLLGELGPDPRASQFAVLLAESYFRATDYRNAATAYAQALSDRRLPAGVTRGVLMYQQVLSLLRSDQPAQLEEALKVLDRLGADPDFDPASRWQAEWNAVKTLQVRGQAVRAYERIGGVLSGAGAAAIAADLRLRLAWLQAKLSLEAGRAEETIGLVDRLLAGPAADSNTSVTASLRQEVAGTARLVRAQALLSLGRDPDGLAELEALRKAFPGSDPAVYSYIIQAKFLSDRGQAVEAQQLLIRLADEYENSQYAAYALYEAAGNAERRGEDRHNQEAFRILHDLVRRFPGNDLVFYAQLKQGDLLRKLNQLGPAQVVYESILNTYPSHRDAPLAELALADTMFAQVTTDTSRLGGAMAHYERLFDLPSAPAELRVEAGFKAGYALSMRGNSTDARRALWLVVDRFLLDQSARNGMGERGRYWLGRTLLVYADLSERAKAAAEARSAYELLLRGGVWGQNTAKAALGRLDSGGR
jgi:TolA-binding protein